ncbi:Alpha/Beta hydrolase protein, partial [Lentinula aff. detonsa]
MSMSSASNVNADDLQKLHFIWSTAPLTSQVNTDFPSLPKTNVTSNEIVFTGVRDHLTFCFLGVPYASPPTASLRFRYPEPWKGTYVNATGFQSACLQFGSFANNDAGPLISRGDVVLVTINYRLNIFGFLGLNTSDSTIPGNFAMAEKITALRWVQKHIASITRRSSSDFAGSWSTVLDGVYALDSAVNQMALGPDAVNGVPFVLGFMPKEGQSLLGSTISPNATDFEQSLLNAIGSTLAKDVRQSGLWTINEDFD